MKPTQQPTEIDIAQMATIIDCEGNIAISQNRRAYHQLHVTIGNRDFRLLEWCKTRFGGAIYRLTYKKELAPTRAVVKRWRSHGRDAATLLRICQPFFIIKREQAEIAIRFMETYKVKYEKYSESDVLRRETLRLELKALTTTGPRLIPVENTVAIEDGKSATTLFSD